MLKPQKIRKIMEGKTIGKTMGKTSEDVPFNPGPPGPRS
jgi:hypothetical protein